MRLIVAEQMKKKLNEWIDATGCDVFTKHHIMEFLNDCDVVEDVPLNGAYIEQIRWERDIALQQLADIGCELGRDMTDIKEKIEAAPVVHGEWLTDRFGFERSICSECRAVYEGDGGNFCPNCGARMDGKAV